MASFAGAGLQCAIAKSFAFIYARNQPNLGLLGFTISNKDFLARAQEGTAIAVDLSSLIVSCGGKDFSFQLSEMEKQLIAVGGMTEAFRKFGKKLFDVMCKKHRPRQAQVRGGLKDIESL